MKGSPSSVLVLSSVAMVLSLGLNVYQYQSREKEDARASAPLGYFSYTNDNGIFTLLSRGKPRGFESCARLALVSDTPAMSAIEAARANLQDPKWIPRTEPVGAFLVLNNDSERSLQRVRAVGRTGSQVQTLATISALSSKECVFVPLDFVPPGATKPEFEVPDEVSLTFDGGESKITRGTPIRWLESDFIRGFPPQAP